MTAEIAIVNREAVALAADSAVTITGAAEGASKIFTSANKIFALSRARPVGIMVYGAAQLFAVPWETTIKMYRDAHAEASFPRLEQYALDFFEFANGSRGLFSEQTQREFVAGTAMAFVARLRALLDTDVERLITSSGSVTTAQVSRLLRGIVRTSEQTVRQAPPVPNLPIRHQRNLIRIYADQFDEAIDAKLGAHDVTPRLRKQLHAVLAGVLSGFPDGFEWSGGAGIVVTGFGEEDIFPRLYQYEIGGMAGNHLRYRQGVALIVDPESGQGGGIAPFAQHEMVVRFVEGVDPRYQREIEEALSLILREYPRIVLSAVPTLSQPEREAIEQMLSNGVGPVVDEVRARLAEKRRELFTEPVTRTVDVLPKDELAAMAEALVNLTSFKRRVSMERETVGGPIDVAVISKGDGFVWIKRKHYFPAEANPQYFARVYGRST